MARSSRRTAAARVLALCLTWCALSTAAPSSISASSPLRWASSASSSSSYRRSCARKPGLGHTHDRWATRNRSANSTRVLRCGVRYAVDAVDDREIPAMQWTYTEPPIRRPAWINRAASRRIGIRSSDGMSSTMKCIEA
eukprot:Amastigsp_a192532_19.p2 type:complete len:139 gc:universal Amastigsp_a192532_19:111-527(+)